MWRLPASSGEAYARDSMVSIEYVRDLLAWPQRDVDADSAPQSLPLLLEEIASHMTTPLSIRATAEKLGMGRDATSTRLNRLVSSFAALWCPQHRCLPNGDHQVSASAPSRS